MRFSSLSFLFQILARECCPDLNRGCVAVTKVATQFAIQCGVAVLAFSPSSQAATGSTVELVSIRTSTVTNSTAGGDALAPVLSPDGRFLSFLSTAQDLVTNHTSGAVLDLFVRDMQAGQTTLVSRNYDGTSGGNGHSAVGAFSTDGRWVTFSSEASDLVTNDFNQAGDVFVWDLQAGTMILVSVNQFGTASGNGTSRAPLISRDGKFVVFESAASDLIPNDTNGIPDLFIRDLEQPALSDDGAVIAFKVNTGYASSLFEHDSHLGQSTLVSTNNVRSNPGMVDWSGPVLSADGRFAAYELQEGQSSSIAVWDSLTGASTVVSRNQQGDTANGPATSPLISSDGRYVSFLSTANNLDTNRVSGSFQLFVRDLDQSTTRLASITPDGKASFPDDVTSVSMSADGRRMAFQARSPWAGGGQNGHYDVFVWNADTGRVGLESERIASTDTPAANGPSTSGPGALSADGRWVAFCSQASDLVPNDTNGVADVFVRDLLAKTNLLVSVATDGLGPGNGVSRQPVFSPSGRWIAFTSRASNLTSTPDTNGLHSSISADGCLIAFESGPQTAPSTPAARQVWVLNRQATSNSFQLVSVNAQGTGPANGNSSWPTISSNGRYVTFQSEATDLVPNDTNGFADIFVRDLLTGQLTRLSTSRFGSMAANSLSLSASASADGETLAFTSFASDLVDGDLNESSDVFAAHLVHTDSDGDGLPDDWELAYFGGLSHDGTADSDGDGLTDLQEFKAGTNPMDPTSTLRILNVSYLNSGEVLMDWISVPGKTYQIQFTQDLNDPAWTDVGRPFVGTSFRATQQLPIALAQ